MANTVGELKRLLEQYPDSMAIARYDDNVGYAIGIDIVRDPKVLGLFDEGDLLPRYYVSRPAWISPERWIKDEEVLVLG